MYLLMDRLWYCDLCRNLWFLSLWGLPPAWSFTLLASSSCPAIFPTMSSNAAVGAYRLGLKFLCRSCLGGGRNESSGVRRGHRRQLLPLGECPVFSEHSDMYLGSSMLHPTSFAALRSFPNFSSSLEWSYAMGIRIINVLVNNPSYPSLALIPFFGCRSG
ncbi:hypothetical protein L218DRAFT_380305 [Marasmius fiardii PR-910]|nr:hypothetical protein L218DRAFT_380305 [Marasmius fiardii PR-910]